jgi:DNA-binding NarL/FixJ family response regulator
MAGILLVDDNPNIRHLLRVYVETQTPFKICGEAEHGVDAIEKARELQPDLVLVDLSMPVLGGAEAASVLKAMLPRTKIILFSMHFNEIPKALAGAIGIDLALSKSDGITKLGEHLKNLLEHKGVDDAPNLEAGSKGIASKPV